MNRVSKLEQATSFVFYITLQVVIAKFIFLFHSAFCFVYVAFLLLLPRRQGNLIILLFISFAVGLLVDTFYSNMGVHAFASVLMIYSRPLLSKLTLSASEYEATTRPTLGNLGWKQFSLFALPLIGIHHTALFLLDTGNPLSFSVPVRSWLLSTLLTYVAVLITQIPKSLLSKK